VLKKIYTNLKLLELKKLNREFPDEGWNVRSLNRLLNKLRDSVSDMKWRLITALSGLQQHVIDGCATV